MDEAAIDKAIEDTKEAATKKVKQLEARRQKLQAMALSDLTKGQRATDTRRKILAGSLTLQMMDGDDDVKRRFMAKLDGYLTRDDDRALFGLPPRPEKP